MTDYCTRMKELEFAGAVDSEEYRLLKLTKALMLAVKDGADVSSLDTSDEVADAGWWDSGGGIELFAVTLKSGKILEFGPDTETVFVYDDALHRERCLREPTVYGPVFAFRM